MGDDLIMANIRVWFHINMTRENADIFKEYLHEKEIYFEPSENYDFVHFACYMTNKERRAANQFLHDVVFKEDYS